MLHEQLPNQMIKNEIPLIFALRPWRACKKKVTKTFIAVEPERPIVFEETGSDTAETPYPTKTTRSDIPCHLSKSSPALNYPQYERRHKTHLPR